MLLFKFYYHCYFCFIFETQCHCAIVTCFGLTGLKPSQKSPCFCLLSVGVRGTMPSCLTPQCTCQGTEPHTTVCKCWKESLSLCVWLQNCLSNMFILESLGAGEVAWVKSTDCSFRCPEFNSPAPTLAVVDTSNLRGSIALFWPPRVPAHMYTKPKPKHTHTHN